MIEFIGFILIISAFVLFKEQEKLLSSKIRSITDRKTMFKYLSYSIIDIFLFFMGTMLLLDIIKYFK